MLDPETTRLLESGCALVLGSAGQDGTPHACRGWGLMVDQAVPGRIRVLVDVHETVALANLGVDRPVAVTGADVPTLRSVQLKGTSLGIEDSTVEDRACMDAYIEAFYDDIVDTDGTPRSTLERLTPDAVVAVVFELADQFDQTPGPSAGRAVGPEGSHG